MSNENINLITEKFVSICKSTDEILNSWSGAGNLQFPVLLGMIAVKLNWDEKQVRENDPIIRYYIRNNSDWHVTRGAHGGIMRSEDKQKKEALRLVKEAAKQQMQVLIDAKVASMTSTVATPSDSLLDDEVESEEDSE